MQTMFLASLMALSAHQSDTASVQSPFIPTSFPAPLTDILQHARRTTNEVIGCTADTSYSQRIIAAPYTTISKAKELEMRLEEARSLAEGIWGGTVPSARHVVNPIKGCSNNRIMKNLEWAERDIAFFEGALQPYLTAMEKGLWIGPMPLCATSVQMAAPDTSAYSGEPLVNIKLSELAAQSFTKMTHASVGRTIAIRYNGVVLSAPIVNEPIYGGAVQISGVEQDDIGRIIEASKAPCG